jgi:hypothetical protein
VDVDAEHRTLVGRFDNPRRSTVFRGVRWNPALSHAFLNHRYFKEAIMGRGILLWLLGVPIPVIILLWLFFGR